LRACVHLLAVDAGGEGGLLELLLHRLGLESVDAGGTDEPARVDEPGQLVAGEERPLQQRVARQLEVLGVGKHRLDHVLGIALLPQDRRAVLRMFVERRMDLVVEVVQQRDDTPAILVLAEMARVPADGRLDVETMMELVADLGADVDWAAPNEVRVHAASLHSHELDAELSSRIRASFLLAGPLLARVGRAVVPPPGGDVIGRRRLDPHIHALTELGATIELNGRYEMRTGGLRGKNIFLDGASVLASESPVMTAWLTPGETVIGNAA